jgi:hypothetical protein
MSVIFMGLKLSAISNQRSGGRQAAAAIGYQLDDGRPAARTAALERVRDPSLRRARARPSVGPAWTDGGSGCLSCGGKEKRAYRLIIMSPEDESKKARKKITTYGATLCQNYLWHERRAISSEALWALSPSC